MFTGREWNPAFGFYEYRARAYNPTLGRFMSEDPIGFQVADAKLSADTKQLFGTKLPETFERSEFNLYRYVGNDPLDRADPFGLLDSIFDASYPKSSYPTFNEAKATLASTARGREILAAPGTVKVASTNENQPTAGSQALKTIFLNPKDPAFLDPKSRRDFSQFPGELPPSAAS